MKDIAIGFFGIMGVLVGIDQCDKADERAQVEASAVQRESHARTRMASYDSAYSALWKDFQTACDSPNYRPGTLNDIVSKRKGLVKRSDSFGDNPILPSEAWYCDRKGGRGAYKSQNFRPVQRGNR